MFIGMFPQGVSVNPRLTQMTNTWMSNAGGQPSFAVDPNRAPGGRQATASQMNYATTQPAPAPVAPAPATSGGSPMNYATTQPAPYQPMLQQTGAGQPMPPHALNMGMANDLAGANPFARYMSPQYNPYLSPDVIKQFMGSMGGGGGMPAMANNLLGAVQGYGARLTPQPGVSGFANQVAGSGNMGYGMVRPPQFFANAAPQLLQKRPVML